MRTLAIATLVLAGCAGPSGGADAGPAPDAGPRGTWTMTLTVPDAGGPLGDSVPFDVQLTLSGADYAFPGQVNMIAVERTTRAGDLAVAYHQADGGYHGVWRPSAIGTWAMHGTYDLPPDGQEVTSPSVVVVVGP